MGANVQELFQIKNRILGVLIQEARQASGHTPLECAKLLGITPEQYASYETGRQSPSLPQLEILSYAFNVPIKHFWGTESLSATRRGHDLEDRAPELLMLRQKIIGIRLRQQREESEMTIEQAAEKSGLRVSRIQGIEQGDVDLPVSELELLVRALRCGMEDLLDEHGPIGNWLQAQDEFDAFQELPPKLRAFMLRPINRSYLDLAMRLSDMKVEELRTIAESILEITF
ncbi:MAG: helix-turn-helix transcriptional regulator [Anaerolineae bacterium]|nr:helix-turn-helix transcriptional regulator [Anaerolineae bacterium]